MFRLDINYVSIVIQWMPLRRESHFDHRSLWCKLCFDRHPMKATPTWITFQSPVALMLITFWSSSTECHSDVNYVSIPIEWRLPRYHLRSYFCRIELRLMWITFQLPSNEGHSDVNYISIAGRFYVNYVSIVIQWMPIRRELHFDHRSLWCKLCHRSLWCKSIVIECRLLWCKLRFDRQQMKVTPILITLLISFHGGHSDVNYVVNYISMKVTPMLIFT